MKTCCCVVLLVSAALCAQAQVSLKLYDDDHAKLNDPSKWSGVAWKDGQARDLRTFRGNRTFNGNWISANAINDRGRVARFALTTTPDSMTTAALTPSNGSSS